MDKICDHSLCTACGACAGICPKKCITFSQDNKESGHIYPTIDQNVCVNCGLCVQTCPANHKVKLRTPTQTMASYSFDENICNTSSSGGVSYSIGLEIIKRGGIVYGCVVEYGTGFRICHKRIDSIPDLAQTQSSKYVHSMIDRSIYESLKKDLIEGRDVLFTGTGCQIAGIRNFLKKEYTNLYTIDIICHGVPPTNLLNDYLSRHYNLSLIKKLSFRSNTGFNINGLYGEFNETINMPLCKNLYMMGFLKGLYYRSACYNCYYANYKRCGDITLGDFWGLKATFKNRPATSQGTSVVLINSDKGEKLFDAIKSNLAFMERPLIEAIAGNPQLKQPSVKHFAYRFFKHFYPIVGFQCAASISLVREKIFFAYVLPLLNKLHRH